LLLVAALALAATGQHYFFQRQDYVWDGVAFYGLAVACFLSAWRLSRAARPRIARHQRPRLQVWLRERPGPAALMALGAFFSGGATVLVQGRALQQGTWDVVILWSLGLVATLIAAFWPAGTGPTEAGQEPDRGRAPKPPWQWARGLRAKLGQISRDSWLEMATVIGLSLGALALRAVALDQFPYTLGGDEAWHGLLARQVLSGELRNPFTMGYMSMPTFFYWPLSWSLWLAGDNVAGLRLPAALAGTATIPVLYLFARDLWGRRAAFLSAAFLAGYDYHVHYSRLGANNVWDPLLVALALWGVNRGLAAGSGIKQSRAFVLAGMVMGLSVYFYTGARLLPPLVAVYVVFYWMQKRRQGALEEASATGGTGASSRLGVSLGLLVLAFLITAGPMLGYALGHPDEWNARINQVGIFQSGWLEREPEVTAKTVPVILAQQFLRSAGAFHVFADRTVWYGADRPLLGFLAGILAVLGMAWAVAHWRDHRHFLVLLWFWSVIITGGMLTESPPSSQRLVLAIPAVALLVAFGLESTAGLAWRLLALDRRWQEIALGVLVFVLAASSVHYYFNEFTPARRYGSENGETATMIGHYLQDLEKDTEVYLFGAPRLYWSFGTMSFLAPGVHGQDVVEPLQAPPGAIDAERGAAFVLLPERAGELAWVQQAYPGGRTQEFHDAAGRLRFITYEVHP
jgi:4-amino-4-deoxy-L-arabinose transferase-like glycosyltransferase